MSSKNCAICNNEITCYSKYKRSICKECFNIRQRNKMRERASTIEVYFTMLLSNIKNTRQRYGIIDIDLPYILDLWSKQNGKCAVSGVSMQYGFGDSDTKKHTKNPFNASIDRIDSSKGYVKGNINLVCTIVNRFKGNGDLDLIYYFCEEIIKNRVGGQIG